MQNTAAAWARCAGTQGEHSRLTPGYNGDSTAQNDGRKGRQNSPRRTRGCAFARSYANKKPKSNSHPRKRQYEESFSGQGAVTVVWRRSDRLVGEASGTTGKQQHRWLLGFVSFCCRQPATSTAMYTTCKGRKKKVPHEAEKKNRGRPNYTKHSSETTNGSATNATATQKNGSTLDMLLSVRVETRTGKVESCPGHPALIVVLERR